MSRASTFVAAWLLLLLAGCPARGDVSGRAGTESSAESVPKPQESREVLLALGNDPVSLDPIEASSANARRVVGQLFDTLVDWSVDSESATPTLVPELLAELPTTSADGRTVAMTMRTGADALRFAADPCLADGDARPVLASDVRASFLRLAEDPSGRSMFANRIAGWNAWAARARDNPGGAPVDPPRIAADDETGALTIELTGPRHEFVSMLAQPQLSVVPGECVEYYDGNEGRAHFRDHPVGSGPFVRDHAASEPSRTIAVIRNEDRPKALRANLERVTFVHIASPETALRQFQAGELALYAPGPEQHRQVFEAGKLRGDRVPAGTEVHTYAEPKVTLLLFVMNDSQGSKDLGLRRAVSLAFDVPRFVSVLRNDSWSVPAQGLLPPGIDGHGASPPYPYAPRAPDVAGARAQLSAPGSRAQPWTLRYATAADESAHREADIFREALAAIDVELAVRHDDAYLARLAMPENDAQAFMVRLDADYLDPEFFYAAFTCRGLLSPFTHHCDPQYDALVARLAATVPGDERTALIRELDARLAETVPMRPIEYPKLIQLQQPWIDGVVRDPINGLRVEQLRLREG